MKRILVTGAAGFIGFHLALALKDCSDVELVLVDSLKPAFPSSMTSIRTDRLRKSGNVIEIVNIAKSSPVELNSLLGKVDLVIHLAASPGVRVPKGDELTYFDNNIVGFTNILNFSALLGIPLIYASSSSVYGDKGLDGPVSEASMDTYTGKGIYALAKWTNEEVSRIYYQNGYVKSVGLRFFSVYGKYGRPDMAYFSFTRKVLGNIPIRIFGSHKFQRDFTPISYVIDDMLFLARKILDGEDEILDRIFEYDGSNTLNIGTGRPVSVETLLKTIEKKLHKDAIVEIGEFVPEESKGTWSDNVKRNFFLPERLELDFEKTIGDFVDWYRDAE
jgi:UDP-glucuronate 4-epimerase